MIRASRLPSSHKAPAWVARIGEVPRALALAPICLALLAPAGARGDIYQWTDEQGRTVISNVLPIESDRAGGVKLLARTSTSAAQAPAAASPPAPTAAEQALEARIENLERQLQSQQAPQQPNYARDYYPVPAPPPPEPVYYSNNYAGYYPAYYPNYYYPAPAVYPLIVVPARPIASRPVFVGRPPVFVGRAPVFVSRPPEFVGRSPVFVSLPAAGLSSRAAYGGRSMHRGRR